MAMVSIERADNHILGEARMTDEGAAGGIPAGQAVLCGW